MGIDFNNFNNLKSELFNIGKGIAKQGGNLDKIDTQSEKLLFDSEIESKCASAGVDASEIYNDTSISSLMGASFSANVKGKEQNNEVVFSEDEISLENMMAMLAPEDGLDIDKLREFNKKPMLSSVEEHNEEISTLQNVDFDSEFAAVVMDEIPAALKHITNSIKTGSATRVQNSIETLDGLAKGDSQIAEVVGLIQHDALYRV